MKCPKCGYPVLPKFTKCPHCDESLIQEDNNTSIHDADDFSVVKGRAIWNVQKGEIAHLIKETELGNTDGLKGVIVQEGCSAIVFANGNITSIMQAGVYTFPIKKDAPVIIDNTPAQSHGIRNFIFSEKKGEKPEQHEKRVERTTEKINKLPNLDACRIYIVSNRLFNLFFDLQVDEEGNYDFAPFVISTKTLDINIAVSLQMQVANMNEFVSNYLADHQSVSTVLFQQELRTCVKSTLAQLLRNLDYQQDGLPEPIVNNLKNRIKSACNEQLCGIEVTKVLDITDESEDFNRFRAAERDLFVNEKELDYLTRSNEFRNRIEQEKNKQEATQAANAEALRQSLQAINKDKLLSEDEMDQFVLMMDSQKRLREAKTKQEEDEALSDMKKSRLVKEEDIAALENVLAQNKVSRDSIVDLMRAQAEQDLAMSKQIADFQLSDNKKDHDLANELKDALHKGKLASTQLDTQRLMDAYQDERRKQEDDYAFAQQQRKDDYQFQQSQRQEDREFNNQQRQREADFKTRIQNEDYDFQKQQRQDEHLFEQDKRKFQTRVQNEDYDFQKMQREQALKEDQEQSNFMRQRQNKFDDLDILERKAAIAQRNMKAMKEAEMAELQEKNRSAETMQSMNINAQVNRDNLYANMTPEQIRAAQLSHLSSEAQAEMAKSYSSEKENELRAQQQAEQKALYEQMMQNQRAQNSQNQEMIMKMAQMMQQGMMGMGQQQVAAQQQRYEDQVAMKQEYRENAMRQQQRTDHTQDSALDNIGRVSAAAASNMNAYGGRGQGYQQQAQPQQPIAHAKACPSCGAEIGADETFCPECGSRV